MFAEIFKTPPFEHNLQKNEGTFSDSYFLNKHKSLARGKKSRTPPWADIIKGPYFVPPFLISLCAHVGCIFCQLPWHSSEHPKSKCLRGKWGKIGVDAHYWAVKPSLRRIAVPAWAEMMHRAQALVWTLQSAWQELKQLLSNETNIPWQLMM